MGPLANSRRLAAMEDIVADAASKGARVRTGGHRLGNRGYFYPLTVITDAGDDVRAAREEPFGPLALIMPVADVEEAIARANSLPYGLAGYGFARAAILQDRISSGLECGNIAINHFNVSTAQTPFGGIKESGYGREGGVEGLETYSFVKTVSRKAE
jgi:succinate-semialdehyde dehydrogenase/glutarate-semialdehyde dehydrogenase